MAALKACWESADVPIKWPPAIRPKTCTSESNWDYRIAVVTNHFTQAQPANDATGDQQPKQPAIINWGATTAGAALYTGISAAITPIRTKAAAIQPNCRPEFRSSTLASTDSIPIRGGNQPDRIEEWPKSSQPF